MGERLPDDLERLGADITTAAERSLATRRRRSELRRLLATVGVLGALTFAVLAPGIREPAQQGVDMLEIAAMPAEAVDGMACDQPHGARFTLPACTVATDGTVLTFRRTYAWR
jgi:hypothetical protein